MSGRLDVLRVPAILCGLALVCCVASCVYLNGPTRKVADILTGIDRSRCNVVPGLGWVDCRGLVLLQLSPDSAAAEEVRSAIRDAKKLPAARAAVRRDYLFIPSYVALLVFLGVLAVRLAEVVGRRWIIVVMFVVIPLQLLAGALDGAENVGLMTMLYLGDKPVTSALATWTFRIAVAKWWLVIAGCLVIMGALGYMMLRSWRQARRRRQAAAA